MKLNKFDLNKSGIYCIRNMVNSKIYIGKSKNIYQRISAHIYHLNVKLKNENRHLINAWHKYGCDNFEYSVIEYLPFDEQKLAERELFWMKELKSTQRQFGYNLRMDSSTQMITHEETKQLLSQNNKGEKNPNYNHKWSKEKRNLSSQQFKQLYKDGILQPNIQATYKGIAVRNQKWKNNPLLKEQMKMKVRQAISKYDIYQYDKTTHQLIQKWSYIADIIKANPTYKRHNIYAVCNGEKPSMYGYIWVKVLKDDIVQTNLKEFD